MSSARILPRPVTDWSGICRNHPSIPPFPHLNELQLAQVPLPPLAPEDPQEAVQHGLLLWPTAVKILLGQDFYAATDPRKKVSHEKKILKVMQLLQSMEVPPAEWVAVVANVWRQSIGRLNLAELHCPSGWLDSKQLEELTLSRLVEDRYSMSLRPPITLADSRQAAACLRHLKLRVAVCLIRLLLSVRRPSLERLQSRGCWMQLLR